MATIMRLRTLSAAFLGAALASAQTSSPDDLLPGSHFKRFRALAAAHSPDDAEGLYLNATVKQLWGSLDDAEKLAERAIAANPKEARYHYRLAVVSGEKAQKASVIHQIGLARKFKKEADATLAIDPNHVRTLDMMLQFYLHAPGIAGGDKAKAQTVADQLMKIDPVEGFRALVTLAQYDKQNDRIEGLWRKSVETRPASWEAHMDLAGWCANQKKLDEAERHAREAIRIHPDRAAAYGLLAAVLVHQDKWNDLDTTLIQAEKSDPDNLVPYYRAANNCLARKVELPRAEHYFRKYLSQEPEPEGSPSLAATHWRLGLLLEQANRKPEAIAELQSAIKLDPNSPAKTDLKRLK
jgi:tetratricopeptide (TPR) repeat protein